MTPIFKEYASYVDEYKAKYGEKTVVLMQVGSFYEIYAILNDTEQLGEVNIYHICQSVMNIAVIKKADQRLMSGFQLSYSGKFIKLLVENNYTIVLVHQVTEKPTILREMVKVISPGTYIEEFNTDTNNYMMSVYIENISNWVAVGISVIDVSTGNNYVYQVSKNLDENYWKDELNRLIGYYNPREFLFQVSNMALTKDDIINYWDIQNATIQFNHYTDTTYECIPYQNELIQKVFEFDSLLTPIEHINMLHKTELRKSYIYMLQYIHEHTVDILRNINLPKDIENIHHLTLTSNSVRQLNVINNYSYYKGKHESLYSICDNCGSIGGRRLLKERLLYPAIDPHILQIRYNRIECLMKDNFFKDIIDNINKLTDLEKSLRRMGLGILDPMGFLPTKLSYDFFNRIIDSLSTNDELTQLYDDYGPSIERYVQFYKRITSLFNFKTFHIPEKPYFQEGYYPDMDELNKRILDTMTYLEILSVRLSKIIDVPNSCKLDSNDKYGFFLSCTKKRSITLGARFKNMPDRALNIRDDEHNILFEISVSDFSYRQKDSNKVFIECSKINELTNVLQKSVSMLKLLNQTYWCQTMSELYTEYNKDLQKVHQFIADLDVSSSIAKGSIQNKYCKPELIESSKSCLIAKEIRHPIVEQISDDTEYITNDVTLGMDDHDGILLFGTNACGKSTLMKAIGLSIIMAQAGFYVPCRSFHFKPYTRIFTRILNNDNIFRAQSSFAVEMMELRSIFQLSDENSMVLGDELCSGTETQSAISIVSKSLDILSKKRTSHVITSHLHQLNNVSLVRNLPNLHIYHLKISCNDNILTYNRKLSMGSGPAIYGLKVCEAMGLSDDFVKGANEILNELMNKTTSIVNTKSSNYNRDVFMDECKICRSLAEETHHIKEQCTADDNGMIDHHHKNKAHNLITLCKSCHNKVTYGTLIIHGWNKTTKGRQLEYEYIDTKQNTKPKKYNEDQIDIIRGYKALVINGDINKTTCINMIDTEHGFRPSSKIITEIFRGTY